MTATAVRRVAIVLLALSTIVPMMPAQALHVTTAPEAPQAPVQDAPPAPETGYTDPDQRLEVRYDTLVEQHRAAVEGLNREISALWGSVDDPPVATSVPLFEDAFAPGTRTGGLGNWTTKPGGSEDTPEWAWRGPSDVIDPFQGELGDGWQVLPAGEANGGSWSGTGESEGEDAAPNPFDVNKSGDDAAMAFTTPDERGYPTGQDTVLLSPVIDLSSLGDLRDQIPRERGRSLSPSCAVDITDPTGPWCSTGSPIDNTYHLFYLVLEHRFSFASDIVAESLDGGRVEVYRADATPEDNGVPLRPHSNVLLHRDAEGRPGPYSSDYRPTAAFTEHDYDDPGAFAGTSDWRVDVFNLTAWAGMKIRLGFHVNTLDAQEAEDLDEEADPGWFIDRAELRAPGYPGQVQIGELLSPQVDRFDVGIPEPAPGEVTYRYPVWNLGSTTETVEVDWAIRRHGSHGPFSDTLAQDTRTLELAPGEVRVLEASADVPKEEDPKRQIVWLNVTARPEGGGSAVQQAQGIAQPDPGVRSFPVRVHEVDSLKPNARIEPASAPPGTQRSLHVTLENRGNVPETVDVEATAFDVPEADDAALEPANRWFDGNHTLEATIPPGERVDATLNLTIPEVTDGKIRVRFSWWNNTLEAQMWDNRTLTVGSGTVQGTLLRIGGDTIAQADCTFPAEGEPLAKDMFACPDDTPRPIGATDGVYWRGQGSLVTLSPQRKLVGYPRMEPEETGRAVASSGGVLGTSGSRGPSVYQGPVTGLEDIALDIRYAAEPQTLELRFHVRGPMSWDESPQPFDAIASVAEAIARPETQVISIQLPPPDDRRSCDRCVHAFERATWRNTRIDVSRLIRENTGINDVWRMGLEQLTISTAETDSGDFVRVDHVNLTGVPRDRPSDARVSLLRTTGHPVEYPVDQESRPVCSVLPEAGSSCRETFRRLGLGIGDPGNPFPSREECRQKLEKHLGQDPGGWGEFICGLPHVGWETVGHEVGSPGDGETTPTSGEPRTPGLEEETFRPVEETTSVWCDVPKGSSSETAVGLWCAEQRPGFNDGWYAQSDADAISDDWRTTSAPWPSEEGDAPTVWHAQEAADSLTSSVPGSDTLYVTAPERLGAVEDPVLEVRHMYEGGRNNPDDVSGDFGVTGSLAVFAQALPVGCTPDEAGDSARCTWSEKTWIEPTGGYPTPFLELPDGTRRPVGGWIQPGSGFYHPDTSGDSSFTVKGPEGWTKKYTPDGSGLRTHVFPLDEANLGFDSSHRAVRFAFAHLGAGVDYHLAELAIHDRPLDLDLEVGPVSLDAAYDLDELGPGPGSEIPVRVQVNNTGRLAVQEAQLELEVRSYEHRVTGGARDEPVCPAEQAVSTQTMRSTVALGPDASTNETLLWSVPEGSSGRWFCLTAHVSAPGLEDQDPVDNRFPRDGRRADDLPPMQARRVADLQVRQSVAPEDAPTGVPRSAVVEVRNAGNAPAHGVEVTRAIDRLAGTTLRARSDTWQLARPLEPASSWIRLDDPMLDASHDAVGTDEPGFRWTPDTSGRYRLSAQIQARDEGAAKVANNRDTSSVTAREVSFQDTVDAAGGQGIDRRQLEGSAWQARDDGGFRSEKSLWVGGDEDGYPDAANATLRLPAADLSAARSAVLSFMTRYDTEQGYDGGVVEASLDDGQTWHPLEPSRVGGEQGYPGPIAGSNPLVPGGDPSRSPGALTGSTPAEGTVNGWVPVTVPLDQIPGFTRPERLADLSPPTTAQGSFRTDGASWYRPSWVAGKAGTLDRFEVYNATRAQPSPIEGERMWYSGMQTDPLEQLDDGSFFLDSSNSIDTILNLSVDVAQHGSPSRDARFQFWDWRDGVTPYDRRGTGGSFKARVTDALGNTFECRTDPQPTHVCQFEVARKASGEPVTRGDWTLRNLTIAPQAFPRVASLPTPLLGTGLADAGNEVGYLFGGRTPGGERQASILSYNASNPTRDPEPLPAQFPGRWGASLVGNGSAKHAYVFGGQIGHGVHAGEATHAERNLTSQILRYNRSEGDAETVSAPLPGNRTGTTAVWNATTGTAYVLGGYGCRENVPSAGCSDPQTLGQAIVFNETTGPRALTNETGVPAQLETARYGPATAWNAQRGIAYVIGGADDEGPLSSIEAFTPWNASTWTLERLELPAPRSNASAAWDPAQRVAYVFGGQGPQGPVTDVVRVDPDAPKDERVEVVAHLPTARANTAAVWDAEASVAYILGGQGPDGKSKANVFRFDPTDRRNPVVHVGGLPGPRTGPVASFDTATRDVVVLGGLAGWEDRNDDGETEARAASVPAFDVEDQRIVEDHLRLPSPRAGTSAFWHQRTQKAYVFGGTCNSTYDFCQQGYLDEIVRVHPDPGATEPVTDRVSVVEEANLAPARAGTSAIWDDRPSSEGGQVAHVLGGGTGNGHVPSVYTFDPTQPSDAGPLEFTFPPRWGASIASNDSAELDYVFGGQTGPAVFSGDDSNLESSILRYDRAEGYTDELSATLPGARRGTAVFWNETTGTAYVIGGHGCSATPGCTDASPAGPLDEIVVYNETRDGGAEALDATLETPRHGAALAWDQDAGGAYVVGGANDAGLLSSIEAFTPWNASSWTLEGLELPAPRSNASAVWNATAEEGYVFGGTCSSTYTDCEQGYLDEIVRVDPDAPETQRVEVVAELPAARANTAAVWDADAGVAYVSGGEGSGGQATEVYRFDPDASQAHRVEVVAHLPKARAEPVPVWDQQAKEVTLLGGLAGWDEDDQPILPATVSVFDATTTIVTTDTLNLPTPRAGVSTVWNATARKAYVLGGEGHHGARDDILTFDPSLPDIEPVRRDGGTLSLPAPRAFAAPLFDEALDQHTRDAEQVTGYDARGADFVYLVGGKAADRSALRIATDTWKITAITLDEPVRHANAMWAGRENTAGPTGTRGHGLVLGDGTDRVTQLIPGAAQSLEGPVNVTFHYSSPSDEESRNRGIREIPGPSGNRGWAIDGVRMLAGDAGTDAFDPKLQIDEDPTMAGISWESQGRIGFSGQNRLPWAWSLLSSPDAYDDRTKAGKRQGNLTAPGGWDSATDHQGRSVWRLAPPTGQRDLPPNTDSRMVSPVIDLTDTATNDATLTLEHAYRFTNTLQDNPERLEGTNIEGGAIEVQVFNRTTGEFDDWRTLLPRPGALAGLTLCDSDRIGVVGCDRKASDPPLRQFIGTSEGEVPDRFAERLAPYSVFALDASPPFPPVKVDMLQSRQTFTTLERVHPALFISGTETQPRTDTFDLSPFVGERIRIAFHAWSNPADHCNTYPEDQVCKEEFWQINEARIDAQVIEGRPVDLRFRFGSDDQVAGRGWGVDDVQLGVSEYARNLALHANTSQIPESVSPGQTFWVNGTVENLGTSPRTGFGVHLAEQNGTDGIEVAAYDGTGFHDGPAGPFSVGRAGSDGSQDRFSFRVKATENLTGPIEEQLSSCPEADRKQGSCLPLPFELRLIQQPEPGAPALLDELTGNKVARFEVNATFQPRLDFRLDTSPLRVDAGDSVQIEPTLENPGPVLLDSALWLNVSRDGQIVDSITERVQLARGERAALDGNEFRLRLEEPGTYKVDGRAVAGSLAVEDAVEIHVGEPVTSFGEGFETGDLARFDARTIPHTQNCEPPVVQDQNGNRKQKAPPQWSTTNATALHGEVSAVFGAPPGQGSYQALSDSALRTETRSLRSLDDPRLTFAHQPLFTPGDGGIVEMRFIGADGSPAFTEDDTNTDPCTRHETRLPNQQGWFLLLPQGGYDAETRSTPATTGDQFGNQGGTGAGDGNQNPLGDGHPVFRSEEPGWRWAVIELTEQGLRGVDDRSMEELFQRYDVQFRLRATSRSAGATGSGWLVDSLAVTSHAVNIETGTDRLPLADGARKVYTFAVDNPTRLDDAYEIGIDWNQTTLPRDTVDVLTHEVDVPAGDTGIARVAVELPVGTSLTRGDYDLVVRARSLDEPLVADKDTLTLGVETVPHADLVPRLETGGTRFEVGSTATLGAVVLNAGDAPSASSKARFVVSRPDGSQLEVVDEVPVPPLPPPGSREGAPRAIVSTNWTVPREKLGAFEVTVEADAFDRVVELEEGDNVATTPVEVVPLQRPDLQVLPTDVQLFTLSGREATSVRPFDLVEVVGTVTNTGNQPATSGRVNVLQGASLVSQVDLGRIPAGASETFSVNLFAPDNTTDIELVARTPDPEFTEANNEASATLVIQESRFDTTLSETNVTAEPGAPARTRLTVTNEGSSPTLLSFRVDEPGFTVRTDPSEVVLPPGGTRTIETVISVDATAELGSHKILLAGLDADGERRMSVPVETTVPRVVEHRVEPQTVARAPGTTSMPVIVENLGNVQDELVLTATHDAFEDAGEATVTLDPGQTQRVSVPVTTPAAQRAGTYEVPIHVESRAGFSTSLPATLTIEPTPRIAIDSQPVREGGAPVEYALTLTNRGNVPATPFLRLASEPTGWQPSLEIPADELAPGQRAEGTLTLSPTGEPSPGIVDLPLKLQIASPHAETARLNQTLRVSVDVRPASLTITDVERRPRFDVAEGDTVEYTARVANEGSGPAAPAHVWLYVDDELADRATVERLPDHSAATVNLTYTARGGEQAVVLSADPMDDVSEFNETDNDLAFTVEAASGLLGVPSVPVLATLLVLLMAAVWRRRDR